MTFINFMCAVSITPDRPLTPREQAGTVAAGFEVGQAK